MAHEQSETIERDGRYYNVYGQGTDQAGQALPVLHDFEQESYDTQEEAVAAAKKRSRLRKVPSNPTTARRKLRAAGSPGFQVSRIDRNDGLLAGVSGIA